MSIINIHNLYISKQFGKFTPVFKFTKKDLETIKEQCRKLSKPQLRLFKAQLARVRTRAKQDLQTLANARQLDRTHSISVLEHFTSDYRKTMADIAYTLKTASSIEVIVDALLKKRSKAAIVKRHKARKV